MNTKNYYTKLLRLIMTSKLPADKMAEMIVALRELEQSHKDELTSKVQTTLNRILKENEYSD